MRVRALGVLMTGVLAAALNAGEAQPDPAELLKKMHTFFVSLNSVACEIDFTRNSVAEGTRREMKLHYDVAFQRPNLLSVQMKSDDTVTYAWICDGTNVFVCMWGAEKYTQSKAPATLDELLISDEARVVRGAVENAFLLDVLLRKDAEIAIPPKVFQNNVKSTVQYASFGEINGEKAHELRFTSSWDNGSKLKTTGSPAERELWISDGAVHLPMRITGSLSTPASAEQISFRVDFTRWLPDVKLDPRIFQFDTKAKAAKRVSGFLEEPPPRPLLNKPAPAAVLDVLDGQRTTLAAHKGRDVVVLDFWSAGCVPCIGLLPKVDAVAKKFKDRGVAFYAMNEGESADDVRAFFKARGIGLTATLRNKDANFDAFKVDAIPMLFVIDKNGVIRAVHSVHTRDLGVELTEQIEALLAGRELPKPRNEFDAK